LPGILQPIHACAPRLDGGSSNRVARFEKGAIQTPENFPPLDLMIVERKKY
jgi:hypothetical protein